MARDSPRMSADERRVSVVRAAITEFARGGYAGTSTAAIARRAGVSQPYLFRLFPDKREIFLAAAERCTLDIRQVFEEAGRGLPPEEAREAMGDAYQALVVDRERVLFQLQMHVAGHAADEAGDRPFADRLRAAFTDLWDASRLLLGADDAETWDFFAHGMLINVLLAQGFPPDHRVWVACPPRIDPGAS
ncbi:TetR/AcrR family transcriptional regulator [Streptomyces sp. DSM 44917]|uniref:TetR/AcrR family transcriptional regulator n=1 Tax=Streptomyces boetiae TaxID=3075541 RepID=A0ABU2L9M1_9ACTN|nr:TetR/AcrR family transcriptional regulator [Streptomyces sp. DSM 44917]MDT0308032.1 TetR/AcrR family transcriptional regulator [Streptomyces sp. DSM 44917]